MAVNSLAVRIRRYLALGVLLLVLGSCSLLMGLVMFVDFQQGDPTAKPSAVFCFLGAGLIVLLVGLALFRNGREQQQRAQREAVEARVLSVAVANNYRVTVPQVAMATELSLEEARSFLESLARQGNVSVEVNDQGVLIYCFRDARH